MNGNEDAQEKLLAELKAIEFWDRDYYRNSEHGRLEQDAHKHRQESRREIRVDLLRRPAEDRLRLLYAS